jgi:hypothetical protein
MIIISCHKCLIFDIDIVTGFSPPFSGFFLALHPIKLDQFTKRRDQLYLEKMATKTVLFSSSSAKGFRVDLKTDTCKKDICIGIFKS